MMKMTLEADMRLALLSAAVLAAALSTSASAIDFTQKAVVRGNGGTWGAIAVDTSKLLHGSALQMATEDDAKAQAIEQCNKASPGGNRALIQSFSNTCMGVALGINNGAAAQVFWHKDDKATIAIGTAIKICSETQGQSECRPITAWCSFPDRNW